MSDDPAVSFAAGAWLAPPAKAPWSDAAVAGVYPHMLDARMAPVSSPELGATTTGRLHFVAYAMGVAQLAVFPTQPVMNVTAAPVLRCAQPTAPPQQQQQQQLPRSALPLALAIASPIALALAVGAAAALFLARRRRRLRAAADANVEPLMEQSQE